MADSTDMPIPTGLADLTPAWLTAALGSTVEAVTVTPIGTGQVADSARLAITWAPGSVGPAHLVAKVTAASEASRAAAAATRTYELEVGFYTHLAAGLPVRAPACSWAGFDAATTSYCVLLEDVAPAQQGDQIGGCTVEEVRLALDELALLHAPRWGDPTLADLGWLHPASLTNGEALGAFIGMLAPGFFDRYRARLTPAVAELIERILPKLSGYGAGWSGVTTIVHGDFRADNLMFPPQSATQHEPHGRRVVVLDWQTIAIGPGLSDVSYLLGGSLLPDVRREHEEALVRRYLTSLHHHGVAMDWDTCWMDYRRFTFAGLLMAIMASMLVGQTDRGDSMFVAMADRAGLHALDLDSEALFGRST